MAFDAVLYFPSASGDGIHPQGKSKIEINGIALTDEWSFSLENKLNITQHTSGAGAGKAQFEAFTIKKQVDNSSPLLLMACGAGAHFQGVTLRLFKAGGMGGLESPLVNCFVVWTFNQFAVEKIEWSYADPAPEENVTFKFGSCAIAYGIQQPTGIITTGNIGGWNQISNQKDIMEGIPGAVAQATLLG